MKGRKKAKGKTRSGMPSVADLKAVGKGKGKGYCP